MNIRVLSRQRRIQDLNQRIIRLSRESLLSLASRFMAHVTSREPRSVARVRRDSTSKQERQRLSMDPQSVLVRRQSYLHICVHSHTSHITHSHACHMWHTHTLTHTYHTHTHTLCGAHTHSHIHTRTYITHTHTHTAAIHCSHPATKTGRPQ